MKKNRMQDFTARDFSVHFPDDDACLEWIKDHLWPDGIHCPVCNKITRHHKLAAKPVYECDRCRRQYPHSLIRSSASPLLRFTYGLTLFTRWLLPEVASLQRPCNASMV